jgi:hypothetical protein
MSAASWGVIMRPLVLALVCLFVLVPFSTGPSHAQACDFSLGFKTMHDEIPDVVGTCLENEHRTDEAGNREQRTTNGLLFWNRSDNVVSFSNGSTIGSTTWLNGPRGLQARAVEGPVFSWETAVLVGAGDIAECRFPGSELTSQLIDGVVAAHPAAIVFTLGDNAYDFGKAEEFAGCYEQRWGKHRSRTRPSPGNHDYATDEAVPYFEYFNAAPVPGGELRAGPAGRGYYSYDFGNWHVVSLNSEREYHEGSEQLLWLEDDLATAQSRAMGSCTLAYWHKPLVSSGARHGDEANRENMEAFWRTLHRFGTEVVLNGHDHIYERSSPQDPNRLADPNGGIRQFIVGTGGAGSHGIGTVKANSEVQLPGVPGVLELTLRANGYAWRYITVNGLMDSGSGNCH